MSTMVRPEPRMRIGASGERPSSAPALHGCSAGRPPSVGFGVVAGGEDRDVRRQRFAGREREPHAVGPLLDVETTRAFAPDGAVGQRLLGEVGDVVAIEAARDERERGRRAGAADAP